MRKEIVIQFILNGLKQTGNFSDCLMYITENLTSEEYKFVDSFFKFLEEKKYTIGHGNIDSRWNEFKSQNINSKLFRVYENDDYGKPTEYMGVFKANSKSEARALASEYHKSPSIVTTGFFNAEEVTQEQLQQEEDLAMKQIKSKTEILD